MTAILIVDDSPFDRRLVGELLSAQLGIPLPPALANSAAGNMPANEPAAAVPWEVQYAVDGRDALNQIARHAPDVVITDLLMPELDGLQLVAAIRENYPHIPVILMTSQGSEEIAVRALQRGAASYVPKRLLMRDLWETIEKVLRAAVEDRGHARLLRCMLRTESIFHLENDPDLFEPLIRYLQEETMRLGVCTEADRVRIGVALEEALTNALYHGNLEFDSEARNRSDYNELVRQRAAHPRYNQRRIEVEARITRSEAAFAIRDEGVGFDPARLPDPTDPENIEKAGGRGILLMRSFMDEVRFNELGNAVVLVKRRAEGS